MMDAPKINPLTRRRLVEEKKRLRESSAKEKALFEGIIQQVHDKGLAAELEEHIKTLMREGERLAHFRSQAQLDHYKKRVKEFITSANRRTFRVKATGFVDSQGDYSTQLIVEKVDSALEELTKLVLTKESKTLQILGQLELIKGMLTDLYQ